MSFYEDMQKMTTKKVVNVKPKVVTKVQTKSLEADDIVADELPLDFVKQYLRIDHEFDDLEIMVATKSAILYVRKYVKLDADTPLDYELIIPILALISHFYENKTAIGKSNERVDSLLNSILDMNRGGIL